MRRAHRSTEPGAEQRIDDHAAPGPARGVERTDRYAGLARGLERQSRIARDAFLGTDQRDFDRPTRVGRQARDHEAVTAVVAGAADHVQRLRTRKVRAQHLEQRAPGARHQHDSGNAVAVDRGTVERAHLGGGVERRRMRRDSGHRG